MRESLAPITPPTLSKAILETQQLKQKELLIKQSSSSVSEMVDPKLLQNKPSRASTGDPSVVCHWHIFLYFCVCVFVCSYIHRIYI